MGAYFFMQKTIIKYTLTALFIAVSFWFYFQVTTYPYKVARWFQPAEAAWVKNFSLACSPGDFWLSSFLSHAVTAQGAYSAQVAFISDSQQQAHCEIGYKDALLGKKVAVEQRYRYASTSKMITAAATLELARQGKLNLSDPVTRFFPELVDFKDARIKQITIAHLLSHSAGFNRATLAGDPMFLRRKQPWCPYNPEHLQTVQLAFSPGEKPLYSNEGFCLLGEIISRVTGEPFRAYMEREFGLAARGIKFVNNTFYSDEVRYDYRYESDYNNSYLALFDFAAISSSAGLSGSALALAQLLWDIHHSRTSPFAWQANLPHCNLQKIDGCFGLGIRHYQPEPNGLMLHVHEGYLPGAASVAVIDSFGGVTVLVKSGKNRPQKNPNNEWVRWVYNRLALHYTLQGRLPVMDGLLGTATGLSASPSYL